MKKVIAFISAAVMLLGCGVSCADKNKGSSVTELSTDLLQLKAAKISMSDSFEEIRSLSTGSTGDILIFGKLTTGGWGAFVTNSYFSEHKDISFTPKDGEIVQSAAMLSYGRKGILTILDGKTLIYIYDSDNKYQETIDCGEILDEDEGYFGRLYGYGNDGFIINLSNQRVIAVDPDGKLRGDIKTDDKLIGGVVKSNSGIMNIMLLTKDELLIDEINADELSPVEKYTYKNIFNSSAYSMGAGAGKYNCVAVISSGIYGFTDTETVKLADFMDLEFKEYEIWEIAMTAENEMVVLTNTGELYKLSEKDISEIRSKETIIMASFSQSGSGLYADEVQAFNAASEDYRIEYRQYFRLQDGNEKTYDDLRMDILSGNAPDLIPLNSNMPVDTFNTDIFCDLYEFIDKDPDFSRDDFLPNLRKGFERNGKMVMLTPTFWFSSVPAKAGYTGVKENWSVDDMIAAYENMPEGMTFYSDEDNQLRQSFFNESLRSTLFVDYDKAECYFDSPEFIKLLSFFNDNHIGLTWDEYNSTISDIITFTPHHGDIYEGRRFVDFEHDPFSAFECFLRIKRGDYKDQLVMVGYPHLGDESGSFITLDGCMTIMADSPHKEGAWSFLRTLISDEYYESPNNYRDFSVMKSKFDEFAEMTMNETYPFWDVDENGRIIEGKMVDMEWSWGYTDAKGKGVVEKIEPFTQEEYDYFYDLVTNAQVIRQDSNIDRIIHEETMSLFNEECTAEECAKKIQNRASLYLSERYG